MVHMDLRSESLLRKQRCNGQGGLITDSTLFACLDSSNKKYLHTEVPALNLRVQY